MISDTKKDEYFETLCSVEGHQQQTEVTFVMLSIINVATAWLLLLNETHFKQMCLVNFQVWGVDLKRKKSLDQNILKGLSNA